eukprot:TRINITY_DN1259_c0_g1_i5.p1 TRINITY_DN1259_c0_g1~~TRINITY_DN1259_c0_g1_i5.p1  ORF type:complete len:319 (-),score=8.34 TRINITY_DN1259_c0_g1_i5:339-1295(-)
MATPDERSQCSTNCDNCLTKEFMLGPTLGHGSVGLVRRCTDLVTGEILACKTIPAAALSTRETLTQALKEIQMMHKVGRNPHIVELRRVVIDPTGIHILVNLCPHGTLFDYMHEVKKLSEAQAANVIRQILLALSQIHAKGVAHRDIKPENILISKIYLGRNFKFLRENHVNHWRISDPSNTDIELHLKVADFGFADFSYERSLSGFCGSPLYMAPEIIQGKSYGVEVDIWSVGVICFTVLCGYMPFSGDTDKEALNSILCTSLKHCMDDESWNTISEDGRDFVSRLMCRSQSHRIKAHEALTHPWLVKYCHRTEAAA